MARDRSPFSLFKRGKEYYARFWSDADERYTVTRATGSTNKARAATIASEMLKSGQVVPRSRDPLLVEYLRAYWQKPPRPVGERYRKQSLSCVEVIAEWPEGARLRLSRVDRGALYRLREWLAEQKTPRMNNVIMQAVKVPLTHAFKTSQLVVNPAAGVDKVPEQPQRRGALSIAEVTQLIAWKGETRIHAALLLACLAGLRRGEIRAMTWACIDYQAGVVRVEQNFTEVDGMKLPKAGSRRVVMLHPSLEKVLRELQEESPYTDPDDFVIQQVTRGRPVAECVLRRGFERAMRDIGIKAAERDKRRITLHSLRHTFVSHMRQALPDYLVQAQSGHRTAEMLENYSDRRVVDFQQYRTAIAAMYKKPVKKKKSG